jgi:pimeloyl-ACP methyl ester carboxylesterase
LLVTLATMLGGCDSFIKSWMVEAPHHGDDVRPAPSDAWWLSLLHVDREMFVTVSPGVTLRLWAIEPDPGKTIGGRPRGTILVLHGHLDNATLMLVKGHDLAAAGYRAIMVDSRGHGGSSGEFTTFGACESRELMSVIDALAAQNLIEGRLGVWGMSMGAATAIQLAGRDKRIKAVVAVAPYTNLREIGAHAIRAFIPVRGWWLSDVDIQRLITEAGEHAGLDPDEADALAAIGRTEAPVLIVSGRWDFVTPHAHSVRLHEAAPDRTELISLPLAGHILAGVDLGGQVKRASIAWFDRHLDGAKRSSTAASDSDRLKASADAGPGAAPARAYP